MSIDSEKVLAKYLKLDNRMSASTPVFNILERRRRTVVIGNANISYELGKQAFRVLEIIARSPLSNRELAQLLSKNRESVKNNLADIFRKVGIKGKAKYKKVKCLYKLMGEGVLVYTPSSQPNTHLYAPCSNDLNQ